MALSLEYNVNEIYNKLKSNSGLFSSLKKYGLLETSGQEQYTEYDISVLSNLATLLYDNEDKILSVKIDTLIDNNVLAKEIANTYGKVILPEPVYRNIFYAMKYGSVKTFFEKNYKHFMPEYDYFEIQSRDKTRILMESFMKEFDDFTDILEKMYDLHDIDKAPDEYLDYLSALIGYERDKNYITDYTFFRALLKNMIEVYKIKGTNYSIELFLSFLGFNIVIEEYWFDRRYFYSSQAKNPYTGETNKNNFSFYLTPIKPSYTIPDGVSYRKVVNIDEFCGQRNLYNFNRAIADNKASALQLLGFDPDYTGEIYTYFKTNVASYNVERIIASGSSVKEEVTSTDLKMIKKYIDFLTPIFIQNNIVLKVDTQEEEIVFFRGMKDENVVYGTLISGITAGIENETLLRNYFKGFFLAEGSSTTDHEGAFTHISSGVEAERIPRRPRTIQDIYNVSKSLTGTTIKPRMSLYGRTVIDANTFYGMSWERADPANHTYEYISDAIFVKSEKV